MSRRIALIYGPETPDGQAVVFSDYVVGVNDAVIAADATSDNPLIVTLPLAATRTLKSEVTVVKIDSSANPVSVIVQGSDTISGVTSINLLNQWDSLVVEAAGTDRWLRIQSGGGGGVSDHGALTGLADDDHKQYQLVDINLVTGTSDFVTDGIAPGTVLYAGSGGDTLTLPTPDADYSGRSYIVGVSDSATSSIDVDVEDASLINGTLATYTILPGSSVQFTCLDGAGVWITQLVSGTQFDLPVWAGQGIAEGEVIRMGVSSPEWTNSVPGVYDFLSGTGWTDNVPVVIPCKNTSAVTISKGQAVYVTGTVGATPVVEIALADCDDPAKMPAIGLAESTMAHNATGYVTVVGVLSGLNTAGYSINSPLYVSTTAGQLTATRPTGVSELVQNIGRVGRVNSSNGEVIVLGPGRTNDVPNAIDAGKLTSGTVATARLGTGTASANTFLRGDQTYQPVPIGNNDMGRVGGAPYLTGLGLSPNTSLNSNFAATPDSTALDITGDIDIAVRVAFNNWTLAQNQMLVAKRQTTSTRSYGFHMFGGNMYFAFSAINGSDVVYVNSSVLVTYSAGEAAWVRVTRNATTGDVIFYTAPDSTSEPSSWTQFGATLTTTPSNIYNSNSQLEIGSNLLGGGGGAGTIYRAIVRDGIGGTIVFDANFATQTADALAFTESSSNAATVTITTNRYAYGVPNVQFTAQGTQALTANTVYYQPFEVTAPLTLDLMALEVTTAAAGSGNLRLGVYAADANLQPTGAPLFDSGDVAVTSGATGILSRQGTPVILQPGVYLTATNSSVALTARTALGGQTMVSTAMGSNLFTVLTSVAQTQGAFPTPGTAWTTRAAATGAARHVAQMRWR